MTFKCTEHKFIFGNTRNVIICCRCGHRPVAQPKKA
jgi:hypothetical protein